MSTLPEIEYTVVMVFPGFGEERENAEQIVEEALHYLNTQKDEPGMRFAQQVSARLEIVSDADQAHDRLQTDDDLATMILHDLEEEEQATLLKACAAKGVPVCLTLPGTEQPRKKPRSPRTGRRTLQVVFREGKSKEPHAHRIVASTLTAPPDDDPEDLMDRVAQLIAVLALGVMEYHWTHNPPQYEAYDAPE